ncbi:MAG: hypothetical protein KAR22_24330, partial [Gammaproteobacteria bacterium]|nr:hypothetical protein [Gammaproteobacteria bacterium]
MSAAVTLATDLVAHNSGVTRAMQKFPIDIVRDAFPALASQCDPAPTVFLDNPAGTQVPARVADAVARAMLTASSNLGGHFSQSRVAE